VPCWDAFTKNSDWVRRADLFEKDGGDAISCSRFGVLLMLAKEHVWRLSVAAGVCVEPEAKALLMHGKPQATAT
jgi:hypothetical protein